MYFGMFNQIRNDYLEYIKYILYIFIYICKLSLLSSELINSVGKFARGRERDGVKYTGRRRRAFSSVPNDGYV